MTIGFLPCFHAIVVERLQIVISELQIAFEGRKPLHRASLVAAISFEP